MLGSGRLGHRPLLAEAPHRQKEDPAPAAAGEGGERCRHGTVATPAVLPALTGASLLILRAKAPYICLVTQQALGLANMVSASGKRRWASNTFSLNLKSHPSGYNF